VGNQESIVLEGREESSILNVLDVLGKMILTEGSAPVIYLSPC
jgi:hypothetical protein